MQDNKTNNYSYNKMLNHSESLVKRIFSVLNIKSVKEYFPVEQKTKYQQQILSDVLKQLYLFTIRTIIAEITKLDKKFNLEQTLQLFDEIRFRKQVFLDIKQPEHWIQSELDVQAIFLDALESELENKSKLLSQQMNEILESRK